MHLRRTETISRAFSLVELVLVLTILAVVSAIAIPRYARSLERYRIDAAAARVITDLAYAQSQARMASTTKVVSVDVADATYTLQQIADINHGTVPYVIDLSVEPYGVVIDSVDFGTSPAEVAFNGYGVPDSGGQIVLSIGPHTRTIELDAQTGKARIK